MDNLSDLKISGMGKTGGGKFRDIKISGRGDIDGDVEAESLIISGMGKINGKAIIEKISVSGMGSISGDLECKSVKDSGTLTVDGFLSADEIHNNGSISVKKGIKSRYINSAGFICSGAGVESEEFRSRGEFKISGLLNANNIDVIFGWHSCAGEIGGEEIRIRHSKYSMSFLLSLFGKRDCLETDLIEGTVIMVENTEAKTIRGNDIIIGDNCRIDLVEYSGRLEISPGAVVKNKVKV